MTIPANSLFETVSFDEEAKDWIFKFANSILVQVSGFWRLLKDGKIVLVSLDQGHQFGLPKPLNLVEEIMALLRDKALLKLSADDSTADVILLLSDAFEIQIFIASAAYETYALSVENKWYIGLGSGEVAIC